MTTTSSKYKRLFGGVAAALLVSGCGAGFGATTQQITSSGYGVTRYADRIRILNALVFAPIPPVRTAPVLSVGVANDGTEPDQLTGIDLVGRWGGEVPGTVQILGPTEIPAGGSLLIGAAASPTSAYLCGASLHPGSSVSLTFRFARAQPVTNVTTIVAPVGGYNAAGGALMPPSAQPVPASCAAATLPMALPAGTARARRAGASGRVPIPGTPRARNIS